MFELFAWLMITLMAGFGGIIIATALKEGTTNGPGRRIPDPKGSNL